MSAEQFNNEVMSELYINQEKLMREMWTTLSQVDVSAQIQKKDNLSFLPWAWAWGVMMKYYPLSSYAFSDRKLEDGTVEVQCVMQVVSGGVEVARHMWLPVMDHRNKPVTNPDARKLSDSKMRCLVKCLAMYGLGHYIYAGEDIPQEEVVDRPYTVKELKNFNKYLNKKDGALEFHGFVNEMRKDEQRYIALYNSFTTDKVNNKKLVDLKNANGKKILDDYVSQLRCLLGACDVDGANQLIEECSKFEQVIIKGELNDDELAALK